MTFASILGEKMGSLFSRTSCPTVAMKQKKADEIELAAAPPDTRRLIRDGRYCNVLSVDNSVPFDDVSVDCSWRALGSRMALVPGGDITLHCDAGVAATGGMEIATIRRDIVSAETTYFDRHCVTNAEYKKFVDAGGYDNPGLWAQEVLPNVLQFVDTTGHSGPKHWANGNPPEDKLDHPVVGVCWHEASAYAIWAGKRLPTTAEWQRAGVWSFREGDGNEPRYPWGNACDPGKANLWASGLATTVAVSDFSAGQTPNGVGQLIGNVWEWVDAQFFPESDGYTDVSLHHVMAEIRGGAFDTYFQSQATCQFRSGQPLQNRGDNIGFRCCISADRLPCA